MGYRLLIVLLSETLQTLGAKVTAYIFHCPNHSIEDPTLDAKVHSGLRDTYTGLLSYIIPKGNLDQTLKKHQPAHKQATSQFTA